MTKFQLGMLASFFLGALAMVVALGIIQLYLEKWREKRGQAREKTAREIQAAIRARFYANQSSLNHLPFPASEESGAEDDVIICYLSILIE